MPIWTPDLASVVDSLYCIAGAVALAKVIHWWCPALGLRTTAGYLALTLMLFSVPLLTPQYQLPLDYIYRFDPWRDAVESPPETTQNPILSDVALQMIPFRTLVRNDLLHAQSPLWSHEMGTGQPLLGNAQSAPLAPLHLLALPLPPLRAMTVTAAWQVFVSLLLMHLLVAQLGASGRSAALAAIAYGLSVFQIGWLYHPLSMVSIWLPGTLLALERLRLGKSRAAAGLVLMLSATVSSGHPGMVAISALVIGVWWLFQVIKSSNRFAFVLTTVVAALIALGLSAPSWLPLTETIPLSERAQLLGQSPDLVQPPDFEPSRLLTLVSP
ncbi:MAG: YfhO family protein [Acidobacteriota bacterium]